MNTSKNVHSSWAIVTSVVGAIALAVVALIVFGRRASPPSTGSTATADRPNVEMAQVQAEVAALRSELRRVKQANEAPVAPADPSRDVEAEPEVTEAPVPLEELQLLQVEHLESSFREETRDRSWSVDTEQQISTVFASDRLPGSKLVETNCAATMCRVVVEHDDQVAQQRLALAVASTEPFDYGVYYSYANDGDAVTTTMYVARTGHDLPRVVVAASR